MEVYDKNDGNYYDYDDDVLMIKVMMMRLR
jgi:hypothetical protein